MVYVSFYSDGRQRNLRDDEQPGYYLVDMDIKTQYATRDMISGVITVSQKEGSRAPRSTVQPEILAIKVNQDLLMTQANEDLEPRIKTLENINKLLTE